MLSILEKDAKAPSVADTLNSLVLNTKAEPGVNLTSVVAPPVSDSLSLTKFVVSLLITTK